MKRELAEELINFIYNNCCGEADIYEDYSGRGMFGKETTGVKSDTSKHEIINEIDRQIEEYEEMENSEDYFEEMDELDSLKESVENISQDQLGLKLILY